MRKSEVKEGMKVKVTKDHNQYTKGDIVTIINLADRDPKHKFVYVRPSSGMLAEYDKLNPIVKKITPLVRKLII